MLGTDTAQSPQASTVTSLACHPSHFQASPQWDSDHYDNGKTVQQSLWHPPAAQWVVHWS